MARAVHWRSTCRACASPGCRAARSTPMWPAASRSAKPARMRSRAHWPAGSNASMAAIRASWGCRCSKRRSCCGVPACRPRSVHKLSTMATHDILINWTPQETRVAIIENGAVQELHVERALERGLVGNVYLGKVARVLPGMQSAFVDVGLERAAFLHVADLHTGNGARAEGAPLV